MKKIISISLIFLTAISCSVKNEYYYAKAIDEVNQMRWNDSVRIKVSDQKCFCKKGIVYSLFLGDESRDKITKIYKEDELARLKLRKDPNKIHNDLPFAKENVKNYNYLMFLSDVKGDTLCVSVLPYNILVERYGHKTYEDFLWFTYTYDYVFVFKGRKIKDVFLGMYNYN